MDKKNNTSKEVSEDLEIRKVVYSRNYAQIILLVILIILFTLTFFCTLFYISQYYDAKINMSDNAQILEITTKYKNVVINNHGNISKTVLEEDTLYNKTIKLENISTISFKTSKDAKKGEFVRYNITKNDFENKAIASTNNDVLVRFMYSYDNKNWEYINNGITTATNTLTPLMGSYYDISGLTANLNVVTNFEINNKKGEETTIYWKCETLLQNIENNIGKGIEAEFKIEYQDN